MKRSVARSIGNREGVGLVHAMMALSLLAIFALVASSIAINEKRAAARDVVYTTAFLSADSAGEAAIAWLQLQDGAPAVRKPGAAESIVHRREDGGMEFAGTRQSYDFTIRARDRERDGAPDQRPRPGYQLGDQGGYVDLYYVIEARGESAAAGVSHVELLVSKLLPSGY